MGEAIKDDIVPGAGLPRQVSPSMRATMESILAAEEAGRGIVRAAEAERDAALAAAAKKAEGIRAAGVVAAREEAGRILGEAAEEARKEKEALLAAAASKTEKELLVPAEERRAAVRRAAERALGG